VKRGFDVDNPVLGIIIPCFNEQDVLETTILRLSEVLSTLKKNTKVHEDSFILFVDDGSTDRTWSIIDSNHKHNSNIIKGIKLSTNFGHQNALLAGLFKAKDIADCVISIDADLQQDEGAIYEFIDKYHEGYDIVFGVRNHRTSDNLLKKFTALSFYNLLSMFGVKIIKNHADYRMMSKRVLQSLSNYEEVNLFLRGIFPIMGYKQTVIYHDVKERFAGQSKYSMKKMIAFALNGITSFSISPIRVVTLIGFLIFTVSLLMSLYVLVISFSKNVVPGWASTLLPIYFFGGVQLLSIGLLGEYIGKIYMEVKKRPRYIVDKEI
jgi:glycosyltransferase involved in cell wall biosynthesis